MFSYGKESFILHPKLVIIKGLIRWFIWLLFEQTNLYILGISIYILVTNDISFGNHSLFVILKRIGFFFFPAAVCFLCLHLMLEVIMWPNFLKQILNFQFCNVYSFLQSLLNIDIKSTTWSASWTDKSLNVSL